MDRAIIVYVSWMLYCCKARRSDTEYRYGASGWRNDGKLWSDSMGATGFDVEPESIGCRSSGADSLNGANKLTANTYQEPLALAA